nr:uncharacterized protein LOC106619876 isoform X2 [Bactrocera oleae]
MNNVASNSRLQRIRSMLVLLAKLLICCNLIVDTTGTIPATTAAVTSMLASASQRNMPHNWLRRQRRYLLFEKGSTVGVQIANTKALIPEQPRGLYYIFECTANYELPTTLDDLWPQLTKAQQQQHTTHNPTTNAAAVHMPNIITFSGSHSNNKYNNSNDDIWLPTQRRQWFSAHRKQQQQARKQQQHLKQYNALQQHRFPSALQEAKSLEFTPPILSRKFAAYPATHQHSVCPRRNVYGSWQHNNVSQLCAAGPKTLGRVRKRRGGGDGENSVGVGIGVAGGKKNNDYAVHRVDERPDEFRFATNAERIFFDLLAQWTQIAALPAARRHATYKKAISHDNLSDCAQRYATLCGLSFLQHFSEVVHGRFMP